MGKREKKFHLGTIKPEIVYDTLVSLLKDTPADSYLKKRLSMVIKSYSVISEIPFRAEVKAETIWFSTTGGSYITCYVFLEGVNTMLTITSSIPGSSMRRINARNIKRLYGELHFRLEASDKPTLDEVLKPSEEIIEKIHPIEHEGIELSSLITNSRILLCRERIIVREIIPSKINNINLERERSKLWIYLAYSGLAFAIPLSIITIMFFIINPYTGPFYFPLTFLGVSLPFILIGAGLTVLGFVLSYQYYLVIQESGESFNIYAKKKILTHLEEIIHYLKRQNLHLDYSWDAPVQKDEKRPLLTQIPEKTKSCPLCGVTNQSSEAFCRECGASL